MLRKKWIASINRYKTVVEEYENTIYVEEAYIVWRVTTYNWISNGLSMLRCWVIIINQVNGMRSLTRYLTKNINLS